MLSSLPSPFALWAPSCALGGCDSSMGDAGGVMPRGFGLADPSAPVRGGGKSLVQRVRQSFTLPSALIFHPVSSRPLISRQESFG